MKSFEEKEKVLVISMFGLKNARNKNGQS